jgi:transcription antitermination factor NusG
MSANLGGLGNLFGGLQGCRNWFAVFTLPRHEKRVREHFCVREIENFLPLLHAKPQWKVESKKVLQLPLFSNYIFVRMGRNDRSSVLAVPGVLSIVGGGRESASVSDAYIEFLRDGLRHGRIEAHPYLTSGTKVRIHSGILAGTEGILLRQKNNCRVVLTLEMIMRSMKVEVQLEDIEPVDPVSRGDLYPVAHVA